MDKILELWARVVMEYGVLWVAVVWLSVVLRKVINSVWINVTDTIERQRAANERKDEMLDKKDEIILELTKQLSSKK